MQATHCCFGTHGQNDDVRPPAPSGIPCPTEFDLEWRSFIKTPVDRPVTKRKRGEREFEALLD